MKSILKASINFGLVNIPVKVYSATEEQVFSFRELHSKCGTPLEHKRWCPKCKKEVAWEDVDKGFPIGKDEYVHLTKEDIKAIMAKTSKTIDIIKFVDVSQIDPIYFNKNYYLAPQEGGEKAYHLFRNILSITGKAAIGKAVIRNKEYLVVIRAYREGLLMTTLHYSYEIRDISEIEELKKVVEIGEMERKLALKLVSSLSGKFDIKHYKDEFADMLKKLIQEKMKGKLIITPEEKIKKIEDLTEALKKSIEKIKKKKKLAEKE